MSKLLEELASKEELEKSNIFEKYLVDQAFKKRVPLIGHFELTPKCNLNCKMCYVHLTEDQMYRPELTTTEWISIIDQACDAGMLYATLSGGECLLHPGFKEIFDHLQSRGVLISILTNGILLNEDMISWLSKRSPRRIQISIYGSCSTGYESVTGNGEAFFYIDKTINLLLQTNIPFDFSVTVSKQLFPDLKEILKYCNSKKTGAVRLNTHLFEARPETERKFKDYQISTNEQDEVSRVEQEVINETYHDSYCDERSKEHKHVRNIFPEKGLVCTAGRFGFAVCWDGKMIPCSIFDYTRAYPLISGFKNCWDLINEKCSNYKNPIECTNCLYNKACRRCPADHFIHVGEGHVNIKFCSEMKQMIETVI